MNNSVWRDLMIASTLSTSRTLRRVWICSVLAVAVLSIFVAWFMSSLFPAHTVTFVFLWVILELFCLAGIVIWIISLGLAWVGRTIERDHKHDPRN